MSQNLSNIYILIPVFNRIEYTLKCLETLAADTFPDAKVIVIDDGSSDGTTEQVAKNFPYVEILQGTGNLWWSGSVNLGLRHVLEKANDDDQVLLINNDTSFPKGYLDACRASAKEHPNALIGSVIVEEGDQETINCGGITINWLTAKFKNLHAGKKLSDLKDRHVEEVSVVTGRGVIIPIKVFRSIDLYNEIGLPQCGDTELPRRAKLAGFNLFIDYRMIVFTPPDDPNHINSRLFFRLSDLPTYLFNVRSNTRVSYRYHFAKKSNRGLIRCLIFLFMDLTRVGGHFIKRLRLL